MTLASGKRRPLQATRECPRHGGCSTGRETEDSLRNRQPSPDAETSISPNLR